MCFSVQADLAVGAAIVPVAALSLREVRCRREVAFAALPTVFAAHQFIESLVWAGDDGDVSSGVAHAAAVAYVVIALPLLPLLVPVAVLLLEPRNRRARMWPFVGLGAVVSAYLAWTVAAHGVQVTAHPHALEYDVGLAAPLVWTVLYVLAVIGAAVLSGYRSIVVFGVLNLVGLVVVAWFYSHTFASLWCIYAAMTSVLALAHLWLRRHLPDLERLGTA
ncbi:DUF6629 family protein [Nocardioides terrisoli]|uniref:DUF6629 family protein n=1 Tax=Nocardioides terrisoli TaxID=3388267 RepID=UPI00287B5EAE|nr:DUF6629 family protein [Nocardioides marmorisolisilvae]